MGLNGVTRQRLERFAERRSFAESRDLEERVLHGLTRAAIAKNSWAVQQIRDIGTEIGRALRELVQRFEDRPFVRNIALASTVAERLGQGVQDQMTGTDLLMKHVNQGLDDADGIKCRVVRSNNYDRELRAFAPARF